MTPKITIIIPVFKVEAYLRQCIDSVLAQTFTDWECICVDDGSPDECPSILDEYGKRDNRIIVIHQKNSGVSVARNAALDVARGEWVVFLDGDDTWESDLLKQLFDRVSEYPGCEVVCFGHVQVDEAGEIIRNYQNICQESFISGDDVLLESRERYSRFIWVCWDKLILKSAVDKLNLRFVKGMRRHEDSLFSQILLAHANHVLILPQISGYHYRMRHESAIHIKDGKLPDNPWKMFLSLYEIWNDQKKRGLKRRLQHMAAAAPTLACGKDFEPNIRSLAIEFLLKDATFNNTILRFMLFNGTWKSRVFSIVYMLSPKSMKRKVLEQLGR